MVIIQLVGYIAQLYYYTGNHNATSIYLFFIYFLSKQTSDHSTAVSVCATDVISFDNASVADMVDNDNASAVDITDNDNASVAEAIGHDN